MAGEGTILKKAREEKGWTYHDVEERIKIRARYLAALEAEEYNILPGQTYTRGFLRTYSKLLGLHSDDIINLYNASFENEPAPEIKPPLTPIQSTPVWFKPIVVVVMAAVAIAIVAGITYFSQSGNNPLAPDYKPPALPIAPAPDMQEPNTADPNNPGTNPSGQPSGEPQPPTNITYDGIVVEATFTQDCWLDVRIDGVSVQKGISAAGTSKEFRGNQKVEFLTIGNAGGIKLKINGKDVPPLGAPKQTINNYVITEETIAAL